MPLIKAAGGGSIINLSAAAGRLGYPLRTPYSAAKWGVDGFTKSLAMEAGPDGVRVNCIQPGFVEGERIDRVIQAKARTRGTRDETQKRELHGSLSLRTTVSAEETATRALFLAPVA